MKRTLIAILVGLALGAAGTWMFLSRHTLTDAPSEEHKETAKEPVAAHPSAELKLSRDMQAAAGLKTEPPQAVEWKPEIKGYGRVLDSAPLLTAALDMDVALAALTASAKEHARLAALFAQNQNASQQALETGEAVLKRDQLLLAAARARLVTAWGSNLATRADLPALAPSLASLQSAIIRMDLLPGQAWEPTPTVQVAPLTMADKWSPAEFLGRAPSADPQGQGLAFLFLLRTNAPAPGTALVGLLPASGTAEPGWRLPSDALIRHEGAVWLYVQTGDDTFVRRPVTLDRRLADDWFVTEGISATTRLVVTGAQLLLSEQLKGAGGEE